MPGGGREVSPVGDDRPRAPPCPRGELGTNSSFSPLQLRGFHRRPSRGRVPRLEGARMGAPAWHHGKPWLTPSASPNPRHANEGSLALLWRGKRLSVRLGRPLMCFYCNSRCAGCTVLDRSARLIHPHRIVKRWIRWVFKVTRMGWGRRVARTLLSALS